MTPLTSSSAPPKPLLSLEDAQQDAKKHYAERVLSSGELMYTHARGMSEILERLDVAEDMHVSAYLSLWLSYEQTRGERESCITALRERWGEQQVQRVVNLAALMHLGENAKITLHADVKHTNADMQAQIERVRKMLLAMAHDIRVVILRLVSRLQTLRYHAKYKVHCPVEVARETLLLYSPLANRLGVWQIKWELEDLAFRFAEPDTYKEISQWLDEKRIERESFVEASIQALDAALKTQHIQADISGRPQTHL